MTNLRNHVVAVAAVVLALALGLLVGSTTLRADAAKGVTDRSGAIARRDTQVAAARAQIRRDRAFDAAVQPYAIGGRLTGVSVVVVSAPGADGATRGSLIDALTLAGATLAGDVRLRPSLLDPEQSSFLGSLVAHLPAPPQGLPAGTGPQRALALLADVLGTRPKRRPESAADVARVLSAYAAGKLLTLAGSQPHPASLAILLAAPAPTAKAGPAAQTAAAQQALLAQLAQRLDDAAVGAVVVGPSSAAEPGGLLDLIRRDKAVSAAVSTVDAAEQPSGVIAAILALGQQAAGSAGSYGGAAGAIAPVPSPTPS